QHHEDNEPREEHLLFDSRAEIAPRESLERHDEDMAAVENRNRQEVEETKVQTDGGHQAEERHPSQLRRFTGELSDAERSHELFGRRLARDQPPDRLEDQTAVLGISLETHRHRFKRRRLDAFGLVDRRDPKVPNRSLATRRYGDGLRSAIA